MILIKIFTAYILCTIIHLLKIKVISEHVQENLCPWLVKLLGITWFLGLTAPFSIFKGSSITSLNLFQALLPPFMNLLVLLIYPPYPRICP